MVIRAVFQSLVVRTGQPPSSKLKYDCNPSSCPSSTEDIVELMDDTSRAEDHSRSSSTKPLKRSPMRNMLAGPSPLAGALMLMSCRLPASTPLT